ncbi:MAG: hypothetical protein JWM98_2369 [Thermoleophilia bacterium]|nr:hypothetical protein [Thermoleophilia bacterium]
MNLPSILTGAAGRARVALQPLETMATHVDGVLGGASHMAGGDIGLQVTGSRHWLLGGETKDLINAARGDLGRALGGRQSAFSAELHAATGNLRSNVGSMERLGMAHPRADVLDGARAATGQVHAAMSELDAAASTTARRRIMAGVVGLGAGAIAAAAGAGALAIPGHGHEMAPGPAGFHPNPEHQY